MKSNSPGLPRLAGGSPIQMIAYFVLGLAVMAAGCSNGAGRMPTGPSALAPSESAAHSGVVQLPASFVTDAGVCEQLTLSWNNLGAGGHLAETWHLEIWEIVSGERVDPKVYNDANHTPASFTLAVSPGTYEVRITAKSSAARVQNSGSVSFFFTVLPCQSSCTLTQGYWKNHADAWPVASLTLGTTSYSSDQLLDILNQPTGGNGLVSLAHQLIAAKLNVANGAAPDDVAAAIAAADALIGGLVVPPVGTDSLHPSVTSALNTTLTNYNEGIIGPGHCEN
jgi:hypothetical protein